MADNPNPAWKRARCEGCREGWPMHDRSTHIMEEVERLGFAFRLPAHCTAPTEAERIAELEAALRLAYKLPRPWIDGGISYQEWETAFDAIERALGPK